MRNGYRLHRKRSSTKSTHDSISLPDMESQRDWSTQSARLRWARKSAGFTSARAVAQDRGWVVETYKTHENGTRLKKGLSEEDARKYARAFRVNLGWLMTGVGEPRRTEGARDGHAIIIGRIGAGAIVEMEDGETGWPTEGIPAEIAGSCDLFEVLGDSMLPLFRDGDILAIERRRIHPRWLLGRLGFVQLDTGERLIKEVARGSEPELFTLLSLNASPMPDVKIIAAGRLAWTKFAA